MLSSADWNWLSGMPVLAASSAITLLARMPSGMATVVWTRAFGLMSSFQASAAPMCLCSRNVPGWSRFDWLLALAAVQKAEADATTPLLTRVVSSEPQAIAPAGTWTSTVP